MDDIAKQMSELEQFRKDNPAVQEAWEQIQVIRALTEKKTEAQQKIHNAKPKWERLYDNIVEGVETENDALREAWEQYFTIKALLKK